MPMDISQKDAFYQGLAMMSDYFADPMSELRQRLYWQTMADWCTLEEWQWAVAQAIDKETFHKVPLIAVFKDYIREHREKRASRQHAADRASRAAARIALEASPEWQATQAKQRAEEAERQEEYLEWRRTASREALMAAGALNPPDPTRWLPLTENFGREGARSLGSVPGMRRLEVTVEGAMEAAREMDDPREASDEEDE